MLMTAQLSPALWGCLSHKTSDASQTWTSARPWKRSNLSCRQLVTPMTRLQDRAGCCALNEFQLSKDMHSAEVFVSHFFLYLNCKNRIFFKASEQFARAVARSNLCRIEMKLFQGQTVSQQWKENGEASCFVILSMQWNQTWLKSSWFPRKQAEMSVQSWPKAASLRKIRLCCSWKLLF